jgi:chromosomal replication initiation ATPase DnaA
MRCRTRTPKQDARRFVPLLHRVADFYGLAPDRITGRDRTAQAVFVRRALMALARARGMSYESIGIQCGGRSANTVIRGIARFRQTLDHDSAERKRWRSFADSIPRIKAGLAFHRRRRPGTKKGRA